MMDHAPDQARLGNLWKDYRSKCHDRIRGRQSILTMSSIALLPIISDACDEKILRVGGKEAWDALSKDEQDLEDSKTYEIIVERIGASEYDSLDPADKRIVDLFVISGCCMHKEHNSSEGGNKEMVKTWAALGLEGPVKLMNRDNAAVVATPGLSVAKQKALETSGAGGIKATSLAGAIFNHKEQNKGQHDTLQVFFLEKLGYKVPFPDTSNIRYGSHCAAASELLVHLPLYREFLEQVRDKKDSGAFNNMERNLYKALHDIPTLTELAALSLYDQAIATRYAALVRRDFTTNHLDLGPLHDDVKAHCCAVIDNPDLLLADDASNITGALYGAAWDRPEAFYAIQSMKHLLPHLSTMVVAMFRGALKTWENFTSEFAADGIITSMTAVEKAKAWRPTTNDPCEGLCGDLRVSMRRAPNMTMAQFNARKMHKTNNTAAYMRAKLDDEKLQDIRKIARTRDSSGLEKKRLAAQAKEDQQQARMKKNRRDANAARKAAAKATLALLLKDLEVILDAEMLRRKPPKAKEIELQLEWHRGFDEEVPKKSHLKNKASKLEALIAAVERHNKCQVEVENFIEEIEAADRELDEEEEEEELYHN